MKTTIRTFAAIAATALIASSQVVRAEAPVAAANQFLPIANEPEPRLFVEPPVAEPLSTRGTAIVPYRTENFRILPIFGAGASTASPRVGHLHVTVDSLPWHWADAGNTGAIVVAGLAAGEHTILIEIATPEHRVISGKIVSFTVPAITHRH